MSNPADEAAHKFFDPEPQRSEPKSEKEEAVRRGRTLVRGLLASAAVIGGVEGAAYLYRILQVWQSYLLTPLIPILATSALLVDHEVMEMQERVRMRRIQDDLTKSSLIVLGGLATMVGLAVLMASVSDDLLRVILDVGAGTSIICAGVYVVKRFSW